MGNNLCATWQKAGYDWSLKKDTHLIRLWAEIFEVREENSETYWGRVSDDVVPVNVAFVQNMAETTFQLTAYNRLVEKIFDVYLIQPGTRIIQATDCFVHWRDSKQNKEWGLNFTISSDARKFRECCTSRIYLSLPKKSVPPAETKKQSTAQQQQQQQQQQQIVQPQNQISPNHSRCLHHVTPRRAMNSKDEKVDSQKLYGTLPNTASSKACQQNRQTMSVYLDNRCCCGLDYQQHQQHQQQLYNSQEKCAVHSGMGLTTSQHQRQYQAQHACSNLYGSVPSSTAESQRRCCRCSASHCQHQAVSGQCNVFKTDHTNLSNVTNCGGQNQCVYQRYSFRQQQQQQQQQACQQNQCCRAALEDNLINYGIYLSVQEANRLKDMERTDRVREVSPSSPHYQHQTTQHHQQDSRNNTICRSCCSKTSSDGECSKNITFTDNSTPPTGIPSLNNNINDNLIQCVTGVENGNKLLNRSVGLNNGADEVFQNCRELKISTHADDDKPISSSFIGNSSLSNVTTSIMIVYSTYTTASTNKTRLSTFTTRNSFVPNAQEASIITFQAQQRQRISQQEQSHEVNTQQLKHISKENVGMVTKISSQQTKFATHPLINWPPPPPPPRQTLPLKRNSAKSKNGPLSTQIVNSIQTQLVSENRNSTCEVLQVSSNQNVSEVSSITTSLSNFSTQSNQETTDVAVMTVVTSTNQPITFQHMNDQESHLAEPPPLSSECFTDKSTPASMTSEFLCEISSSTQANNFLTATTFTKSGFSDTSGTLSSDMKPLITTSKPKCDQKPAIKAKPQYHIERQIKENNDKVRLSESEVELFSKERDHFTENSDKEMKFTSPDQDICHRSSVSTPPKDEEDLVDGTDWSEVRRFNTSDISGSECGGDDDDDAGDLDDDEDDDDSSDSSSIRTVPSQDSLVSKSTVVRRSGYLAAKNWLVHHKKKTEMAQKRSWKKYRVCLKGNVLWFYEADGGDSSSLENCKTENLPKHKLVIESCLVQPFPEHPKKEFVFSLSTAFGDAYLFQASSQVDLDKWISAIHSACAVSLARQHGRENTLKLLRNEIHRIKNSIELDIKMRKMASLHLATVTDQRSRQAIEKQMNQWEDNLEKLYIDQHRLKCYTSSLQGAELPNAKTLLGCMSKQTKATLARIGVLTATSFHAAACARQQRKEAGLASNDVLCGGLHKQYCPLSSFKVDENNQVKIRGCAVGTKYGHSTCQLSKLRLVDPAMTSVSSSNFVMSSIIKVMLSNNQHVSVEVNDKTTVRDVIEAVCGRSRLNPSDHFLRMHMTRDSYRVPDKMVFIQSETSYEFIELCQKLIFQVELQRSERERELGIRVEAELADDVDQEDELCLFISEITKDGLAYKKSLSVGDEILVINGDVVSRLDMVHIEGVLQDSTTLLLTIRSCSIERSPYLHHDLKSNNLKQQNDVSRGNPANQSTHPHYCPHHFQTSSPLPNTTVSHVTSSNSIGQPVSVEQRSNAVAHGGYSVMHATQSNSYIEKMICPPPPNFVPMSDKRISDLIVPEPSLGHSDKSPDDIPDLLRTKKDDAMHDPVNFLLKGASKVNHMCQLQYNPNDPFLESSSSLTPPPPRPLSNAQHTCKVVMELIDTEKHYIRDLVSLIERYLEPLRDEMLLSGDDLDQLFGNIRGIVQFQKLFLTSLEEAIETIPNFDSYHQNASNFREEDLRRVLTLIGSSFMYYAHHFKLYSSFCASHSKAQKMISCEDNSILQEFLKARNPKQQHSSTIESFLIKPIQRILKYPLLLKQLVELTQPQSDEHLHLKDALHAMEAVAEHINEMQKIYEEYGVVLEELVKQHKQLHTSCSKIIDLNVGELQMYGTVNWINPMDEIGKIKKDYELLTLVFIFKTAVVILAQERPRPKKKGKPPPSTRTSLGGFPAECTRFKLAIPVDQLQVRTLVGDTNDKHGLWEIVHCRSEREGRPKKVFQFISSHKARNDFIRTIHHTMHESIRKSSASSNVKTKSMFRYPGQHKHPLSTATPESISVSKQSPCESGYKQSKDSRTSSTTPGEPSSSGNDPLRPINQEGKTITQATDTRTHQLPRNFR